MPLYRHQGKLIYFAHVPKCAGTSVTEYLRARFGEPAFEDRAFRRDPPAFPWSHTSPQHITNAARQRILPDAFIDFQFAVVRHPVARLTSVYRFQKKSQKTISRFMSFSRWLRTLPKSIARQPYRYDAHPLPQTRFVSPNAEVFRLEDGLDALTDRLDQLFGTFNAPGGMGHAKKSDDATDVTPADIALIAKIYADDFETFGYD